MISFGEDLLICDMAETYHIYDMYSLDLKLLSTLASGLRDDSRIKVAMTGQNISLDMKIQATIADTLRYLLWFKTEDGAKGLNRPESILSILTGEYEKDKGEGYASPEEFEMARYGKIRR